MCIGFVCVCMCILKAKKDMEEYNELIKMVASGEGLGIKVVKGLLSRICNTLITYNTFVFYLYN